MTDARAIVVAATLMLCMSCSRTVDEVRAKKFVLIDDKGQVRATLNHTDTGAILELRTKSGALTRVAFDGREQPRIELRNEHGELRASMGIGGDGEAGVLLLHQSGEPKMVMGLPFR